VSTHSTSLFSTNRAVTQIKLRNAKSRMRLSRHGRRTEGRCSHLSQSASTTAPIGKHVAWWSIRYSASRVRAAYRRSTRGGRRYASLVPGRDLVARSALQAPRRTDAAAGKV